MRRKNKKEKEYMPEHGEEEKVWRREKIKKWILMFFTYREEEEEEQRSSVCCEIRDYMLFIGVFYQRFYRRIIKY
jgi:hypothetical protein